MQREPVDVVICRSNPVAPDPRVEKCAEALVKAGYGVRILAWDRSGEHLTNESKNNYRIERIKILGKIRQWYPKPDSIIALANCIRLVASQ